MSVTLTVFFDDPFYAALVERNENGRLTVAKAVFGAEPSDPAVYEWVLSDFQRLRFSPPVDGVKPVRVAANPKRRQRLAARGADAGIGTKSQQALKLAQEQRKDERATICRARREAEESRRFERKREQKKAKHKGR